MTHQLIKYEAACRALADCKAVDEVKVWADKAAAMQAYGRMAKDKTLEVDAAEIRIRAERRLGEMLGAQKADGGLNRGARMAGGGQVPAVVCDDRREKPTLADAGISKDLSSRAQRLAAVPEAEFEAEVGEWRDRVQAEGARVSARLEAAGERAMRKPEKTASVESAGLADSLGSMDDIVEEQEREIRALQEDLKALRVTDKDAELLKWRRMYDNAVRQQEEAMERAQRERKAHEFKHRQLMRCGKSVGEDDPDKIAPAVEAFVRRHKVAA